MYSLQFSLAYLSLQEFRINPKITTLNQPLKMSYTTLTILSIIITICLDFFLKTKLLLKPKFWLFLGLVVIAQTIVDNYLNGRWWLNEPIVGPYSGEFFSQIKVWHTPLENYFFGLALIVSNCIVFEYLLARKERKERKGVKEGARES
jgi:lycopene cyclase domain-containing protein